MDTNKTQILAVLLAVYILLLFIPFGEYILYPITLIVTFLHELGHAFFAIITGGSVNSIHVNSNGSGLAITSGGWSPIILMGGYIGSALFGNLLLYYGLKEGKVAEGIMYSLGGLMILVAIFFFGSFASSFLLILIGSGLIYIAKKLDYDSIILSFLGLASILHIITDFRVGPSSDLAKFSDTFIIIPQVVWMYAWLLVVIAMFGYNLKIILKR